MNISKALDPSLEKTYTEIIDGILATSDLNTISAKALRKGLAERGYEVTPDQKVRLHLSYLPLWPKLPRCRFQLTSAA